MRGVRARGWSLVLSETPDKCWSVLPIGDYLGGDEVPSRTSASDRDQPSLPPPPRTTYNNTTAITTLEYRVRTTVGSTARKVSHRIASGLGEGTRESPGLGKEVPCSAVQFQNAGGELVLNNYSTVATRCALGAKMCEAIAKEVRTRTVWSPVGSRIVSCD